ncbi:MAG: diguanylate cyclase [Burkholderiaceae bacterium]|nr:diguanylate cyclase [Burkholderiaceae bacterium]
MAELTSAQLAKATLRRLAVGQLEPTPENYARAWTQEAGTDASLAELPPTGTAVQWASLIEGLVRGIERGGRQWTAARKKDSLRRVLDSSRTDMQRLHDRLRQLVASWDGDSDGTAIQTRPAELAEPSLLPPSGAMHSQPPAPGAGHAGWGAVVASLEGTVQAALPGDEARARELADTLAALARRIDCKGADAAVAAELEHSCIEARRLLVQRHQLVDQLAALARELTAGLTELAEDDSWARGQAQAMLARLGPADGSAALSVRNVRATKDLLAQTRRQQKQLKGERDRARDALKTLVQSLAAELGDLGGRTGRFGAQLGSYADSIEQADSLDGLATLVHDMVQESRAVQSEVAGASTRLQAGQAEAATLSSRVRELEGELRRLSEEVAVDALTQVANRRGLALAFETESARHARDGNTLAVALIDIDNFKKLNDSLGHVAGDEALKALAARVRAALRPVDHVARFGGEEFVMLLPATSVDPAQQALTRLQRDLTASLFMHEGREVFVTFSGGVTAWRVGEALDTAIERADEALYEAKHTGKNRTCVA